MKNVSLIALFISLIALAIGAFLFSCVVTLSDGQGALIFIFSVPLMALLLVLSWLIARFIDKTNKFKIRLGWISKALSLFLVTFFVSLFIPYLNLVPSAFLGVTGEAFQAFTGKTPYAYFRARNSFPNLLAKEIGDGAKTQIDFSTLGASFAWDRVCIFGPYTTNEQARSILNLDWNIEAQSEIKYSDSINALVFLNAGKVNQVVDLSRGIVDFKELDLCLDRKQTQFSLKKDADGRKILARD